MTTENVNALRAEVEGLQRQYDEMDRAVSRFRRLLIERRLSLYEAEGRGQCVEARVIRADLAGDNAGFYAALAEKHPSDPYAQLRVKEYAKPRLVVVEEHASHVVTVDAYDPEGHASSAGLVLGGAP